MLYTYITDRRPEACRSGPPLAAANCNNHLVRVSSLIHYHHDRMPFLYVLRQVTILRFYRFRSKNNSSLSPTIIRSKVIRPTVFRPTVFKSTQKF